MLVVPGEVVWIDVLVPAATRCGTTTSPAPRIGSARRGVSRSAWGRAPGAMVRSLVGAICFAGVGPGEVLVDGAKVVGSPSAARVGVPLPVRRPRTWDPSELARRPAR